MTVKPTSREAYARVLDTGQFGAMTRAVVLYLEAHEEITRAQISEGMGIRINSVCAPVLRLIEGCHVEVVRKDLCPITGFRAEILRLTPLGEMLAATLKREE